MAGELDRSGENDPANELDISAGTKEAFVVDVSMSQPRSQASQLF